VWLSFIEIYHDGVIFLIDLGLNRVYKTFLIISIRTNDFYQDTLVQCGVQAWGAV
jgi:hypothetical protein